MALYFDETFHFLTHVHVLGEQICNKFTLLYTVVMFYDSIVRYFMNLPA